MVHKAYDIFTEEVFEKKDLTFNNKIKDQYHKIDIGSTVGLGYHLLEGNGMNIGVRYYYGFLNILKDNDGAAQRNSSIYLFVGIPIGVKKAEAKQEQKKG